MVDKDVAPGQTIPHDADNQHVDDSISFSISPNEVEVCNYFFQEIRRCYCYADKIPTIQLKKSVQQVKKGVH